MIEMNILTDDDNIETEAEINVVSGGGSGGTSDYRQLTNKPSINGITLDGDVKTGNKTFTARVSGRRLIMNVVDEGNEVSY